MDVPLVVEALAEAIRAGAQLRAFAYPPDDPSPPCAYVTVDRIDYHDTAGGGTRADLTITVLASRGSAIDATERLYEHLSRSGARSIREAVETDRTLGGVVDSAVVSNGRLAASVSTGEAVYGAAQLEVEVLA